MRFRFNILISALGAMILFIIGIAWMQSASSAPVDTAQLSARCGSCHAMEQQVATWKESTHQTVPCISCHANAGVMGWLHQQAGQVQMWLANREPGSGPVQGDTTVPSERCIACHASEMPFVMQDLDPNKRVDEAGGRLPLEKSKVTFLPAAAGHDLHLTMKEPLSCADCHAGAAHGPGEGERVQQVTAMHDLCLNCHAEQQIPVTTRSTVSCSACHLELDRVKPEDHKELAFRSSHGKAALGTAATCQQCHLNPGIGGQPAWDEGATTTVDTAATLPHTLVASQHSFPQLGLAPTYPPGSLRPAKGLKDGCASCHGITMPHPKDWLGQHAGGYSEKPELCASCHGTRNQGFDMRYRGNVRTLSTDEPKCLECHAQPMPHPETWVQAGHSAQALSRPTTCTQCHSAANPANPTALHASPAYCLDCHSVMYRHPTGWIAAHAKTVARFGGSQSAAGCSECHTATVNTCTSCHTTGVGKKQQWHPNMWWIKHAWTTTPATAASCKSCHNYVQPSCSQCHRRY